MDNPTNQIRPLSLPTLCTPGAALREEDASLLRDAYVPAVVVDPLHKKASFRLAKALGAPDKTVL